MKRVDNEAGVMYARKGYYKGTEVVVTHRYGSQVWLEDYPVKHGGGPTEYGCWVEGESVTYKDDLSAKSEQNSTPNNRKPDQSKQQLAQKKSGGGYSNKPYTKKQNYSSSSPKGNNVTKNSRGSSRKV